MLRLTPAIFSAVLAATLVGGEARAHEGRPAGEVTPCEPPTPTTPLTPAAGAPAPMSPAEPPAEDFPLGATITLGISGAAIVLGAIVGGVAISRAADIKEQCTGNVCPLSLAADGENAEKWADASTALLVAGGLAAVMGTTWLIIDLTAPSDEQPADAPWSARLSGSGAEIQIRW